MSTWEALSPTLSKSVRQARLELHHAAQAVASIGFTWVEPKADDSHANLGWDPSLRALVGRETTAIPPLQAALRVDDLTLLLLRPGPEIIGSFPLTGKTIDEAYAWLQGALNQAVGSPLLKELFRPTHEIPAHPVADGAAFQARPSEAFEEITRWYANSHTLLEGVRQHHSGAAEVRCWPHHFDIATLIRLDPEPDKARTLGVGMTPGVRDYPEPYLYVSPWPYPSSPPAPPLRGNGHWHTDRWYGAVLPGSKLQSDQGSEQQQQTTAFLESAIDAALQMLRGEG